MLTFFRRIRKGLLGDGAASKYLLYAVGEVLLVVIGILIALQINNWNQNRLDRHKEILLLTEIHKEFLHNREELKSTLWLHMRVFNQCQAISEYFPIRLHEINRDTIAKLFYRIHDSPDADVLMGSISTLVNTSSFEIISNAELRSLLLQWEDLYSDYEERESRTTDHSIQSFIPYFDNRIPRPYEDGIRDERVDLAFLETIEFQNLINRRIEMVNYMLRIADGEESKIVSSINRIIELSDMGNDQGR